MYATAHAESREPAAMVRDLEGPRERLVELARVLVGRIRRRPLTALAVAVGAGFVLGGALSFRAGRTALAAAGRHVARELLKQVL